MAYITSPVIKFGEWVPDRPAYGSGGASVAKNVIPYGENYISIGSLSGTGDALNSACLGVFSIKDRSGAVHTFAGTSAALYKKNGTSWDDVSKSGGYNTDAEGRWVFVQYGDYVIASNHADSTQYFDVSSSTLFADLSADAPQAKVLAVINNFIVCGNTYDGVDGNQSDRVRWSGINAPASWGVSASTQADYQNVAGYGAVAGIIGSQNGGVVVQEGGLHRMEYVGTPNVFNFYLVEGAAGSEYQGSVAGYGGVVFYYASNGFHMFGGETATPIGYNKVDKWFNENLDKSNTHKMWSAVDPKKHIYMVAFPSVDGSGACDKILYYSWISNRWSYSDNNIQVIGRIYSDSTTFDSISGTFEDYEVSMDSAQFAGGKTDLIAFTSSNKIGYFNGDSMVGEMTTEEVRLNQSGRAYVSGVTPVIDCDCATVSLGSRSLQSDSITYTPEQTVSAVTGDANFTCDARFHRASVKTTGNWGQAQGVQVKYKNSGVL